MVSSPFLGYMTALVATNNTVDIKTEPSEIQFENGSDHAVVASYSELYEEGEVEHINGPSHPPCAYSAGV